MASLHSNHNQDNDLLKMMIYLYNIPLKETFTLQLTMDNKCLFVSL